MISSVALRPLAEKDGPALAGLSYSSPDNGRIRYAANYQVDAVQALRALHGDVEGVAACSPGSHRLVGFGMLRFGECLYEGELRPYALLGNLIVHPDYRRRGLASQLVDWQVQRARERAGSEAVLLANFQSGSSSTEHIFRRWLPGLITPLAYIPLRTLPDAPLSPPHLLTGPLGEDEFGAFASGLNEFSANANFYQPVTAESLAQLRARSPLPSPFRHFYSVVDTSGNLLAGLVAMEEYRIKQMEVHGMPGRLRLLNRLLRFIPTDGTVREMYLDHIWYAPGQIAAARHLIDTVRWIWHGRATTISVFIDPRGPLRHIFPIRPWSMMARTSLALSGPKKVNRRRWVSPIY